MSCEFVNFLGEDRVFSCVGQNIKWLLPNGSKVSSNAKYQINNVTEEESQLHIKNVAAIDVGEYRCVSNGKVQKFQLNTYCESRNRSPTLF